MVMIYRLSFFSDEQCCTVCTTTLLIFYKNLGLVAAIISVIQRCLLQHVCTYPRLSFEWVIGQ